MTKQEMIKQIGRARLRAYLDEGNNKDDLIEMVINMLPMKDLMDIQVSMQELDDYMEGSE